MKEIVRWILRKTGYEIKRIPKGDRIKATGDLKAIFSFVYKNNVWGGTKGEFYSGPGSDDKVTQDYVKLINQFIKDKDIKSIVDLGCGDYRVGQLIEKDGIIYTGVDIVDSLIDNNNRIFGTSNVSFKCMNAVEGQLPDADLCLIRQVLQHLSNSDIMRVLSNCAKYKFVIISEHIPANPNAIPNLDMNSNWDIRLTQGSGVYIDKPPFNYYALNLLETNPEHRGLNDSVIRTSLIENHNGS